MRSADIPRDDLFCQYCGKQCKNLNSLKLHEVYCKENPNRKIPTNNLKGTKRQKPAWNKGLTKETDERVAKIVDKRRMSYNSGKIKRSSGIASTPEKEAIRREKISQTMKKNKSSGGYRRGSGRGKKGWYKGFWCDSSWELAYVIYHLDHGLMIERCKEKRSYIYNNEIHTYVPDFITDEGIIEIKGYKTDQWDSKFEQNSDIHVLYEEDMKLYLDYVIDVYGKDFIKLYE